VGSAVGSSVGEGVGYCHPQPRLCQMPRHVPQTADLGESLNAPPWARAWVSQSAPPSGTPWAPGAARSNPIRSLPDPCERRFV
jgi:hypothetical protein